MKKLNLTFVLVCLSGLIIAQPAFLEITEPAGVKFGGQQVGIAFSDFDKDGDDDFYVSLRNGSNLLFENLGNNNFINVAAQAGVNNKKSSRSSIWLDINNDGFQDLYVSSFFDGDDLYLNNGDKTFTNITRQAGIKNEARPFSVNTADVNGDGYLDIYVANFQSENVLYLNNKDNTFTNIIERSGAKSLFNAMGVVFFDYDKDNDADLYLTHDGQPYILYENIGGGNYRDVSEAAGVNYDGNGMGVDVGDVNNDGWLDIYITNLYENVLYINNGDGTFSDISQSAGVDDYGMGWGTNFLDYNNDGKLDIYVNNDTYFSPYPNVLYENQGDLNFKEVESETALASEQGGYGSACADINLDGLIDLAIANAGSKDNLQLFRNQMEKGNWIGFKLEGVTSNRDAVGAKLELVDANNVIHMEEVVSGSGYASQNSLGIHFGLGTAVGIQSANLIWPSGTRQSLGSLEVNNYYKVIEGSEATLLTSNDLTNTNNQKKPSLNYKLYPNPSNHEIQLEILLGESSNLQFEWYSQSGQLMAQNKQTKVPAGFNQISLPLPAIISSGLYQLSIKGETFQLSQWVQVQR